MKKNMIMSVLARVVALVTGMVVQREILLAYGSSLNGLTSAIAQVMSYLVLLEAGLGAASIQALYAPLAHDEWNKVSGIISATGLAYKKISRLFLLILIVVSALLPMVVLDEVTYVLAAGLTLITGGSYVLSYIVGGKYKAILNADRKVYILYILDIITLTLSCGGRIIALRLGYNILIVQLINLATVGVKNVGYVIYVKKNYTSIDYSYKPDLKAIGKRWSVLLHNIAGIVVNHTDIMILTLFSNLKIVSVYSVYNMIFSQLSTTIQSTFLQAPQASFGRMYNNDIKAFNKMFSRYEYMFDLLLYYITAISVFMILPFVSVYTKGVTDIKYIDWWLPILFGAILLMSQIRTPSIIMINVAGAFAETQRGAVVEAVINLVVSLSLFFFTDFGIHGLLIGTVCSYLYRTVDVIVFNYRKLITVPVSGFIKNNIINSLSFCLCFIVFYILKPVMVSNFFEWIVQAVIVALVCGLVFLVFNLLMNRKNTIESFTFAIASLKKRGA